MSTNKLPRISLALMSIFAPGTAFSLDRMGPALANYTRPLGFEPNRGQMDRRIDFLVQGAGYSVFLSHADAIVVLSQGAPPLRMSPVGASPAAAEPIDQLSSTSNYFIGNLPEHWRTNIPNYAKVRYRNVYPNVDLIYHGNQRQLEYDFVISPGADPRNIVLEFQGAAKIDLDREGDLLAHMPSRELRWHKPVAYQDFNGVRKAVTCSYIRKGGDRLAFRLAAYDRAKPLIIDPVLEYSTYLGGSGSGFVPFVGNFGDYGSAIAVDANGSAYVTGFTFSADFPVKNAFEKLYLGYFFDTSNAFVSKFDSRGELVYSTYLGGTSNDQGVGIAVDAYGNAYVTGEANSVDFPIKNAFQSSNRSVSAANAFVTKLDPEGNALVYSTYVGGSVNDSASAIAVDAQDHAYVTGITTSTDFPLKNAFQKKLKNACGNAFITKLDAPGNEVVYSTYLGGSGCATYKNGQINLGDIGNGIAVDKYGQAYVTGTTTSSDFPTKNAFQSHLKGTCGQYCSNAFVTKFDPAGSALVYSTYLGGSGQPAGFGHGDSGNAIVVDLLGNAYVAGYTNSTDFPTKNAFQHALKNQTEPAAFITKLDPAGTALVYSTYLGGSAGDAAYAIALDSGSHPFVTGVTASPDFPIENAFQGKPGCRPSQLCQNAFVTKFHYDGALLFYSSYLGGSSSDSGNGIAVDKYGNAYLTGLAISPDFPTKNAFQNMLKSTNGNAFVAKISAK